MNIFMANPTVTVGLISFISAQIIKTALFAIKQKTFNPSCITGAGRHAVVALGAGGIRCCCIAAAGGFSSSTVALSIIIMGIVIYDALSVRYNAGLHGKELNRLRKVIDEMDDEISRLSGEERDEKMEELSDRKDFKEFLGHKPIEVLAGALLGILIAMLFPLPA